MTSLWLHFPDATTTAERAEILDGLRCLERNRLTGYDPDIDHVSRMLVTLVDHRISSVFLRTDDADSIQRLLRLAYGAKLEVEYRQVASRSRGSGDSSPSRWSLGHLPN